MEQEIYYKYTSMPLDNNFGDKIFYSKVNWDRKFSWLPHRCQLTDKILWLQMAIRGTSVYHGSPGNPFVEHRWHDSREHLIWLLKK